jgi:hypothetical protein
MFPEVFGKIERDMESFGGGLSAPEVPLLESLQLVLELAL